MEENESMIYDDIEYYEGACPKCDEWTVRQKTCGHCDEFGMSHHDCGEDCCCCEYPENNRKCDECGGEGVHRWCSNCAWDLIQNRYLNGRDERPQRQAV